MPPALSAPRLRLAPVNAWALTTCMRRICQALREQLHALHVQRDGAPAGVQGEGFQGRHRAAKPLSSHALHGREVERE